MKPLLFAAALSAAIYLPAAHATSFNCARASTLVEHEICQNPELSRLYDALDALYKRNNNNIDDLPTESEDAISEAAKLLAGQKAWIRERNRCTTSACLVDQYRKRIDALCTNLEWHDPAGTAKKCQARGGLGIFDLDD